MLTLKVTWYPRSWIPRGFYHAQSWLLWTLNTPSCIKHALSIRRILRKNSSSAVCWCYSLLQDCSHSEQSSGNRCAFCEQWYECNWSSWSTSGIVNWSNLSSYVISYELSHGFGFPPAVMMPSLAGVHTFCRQHALTYAMGVTHRDTASAVETH
jgi:hypothetical protein